MAAFAPSVIRRVLIIEMGFMRPESAYDLHHQQLCCKRGGIIILASCYEPYRLIQSILSATNENGFPRKCAAIMKGFRKLFYIKNIQDYFSLFDFITKDIC